MKNEAEKIWLPSLIQTEEYKNVLLISSRYELCISSISEIVCSLDGNLIVSTNSISPSNDKVIYVDNDIKRILPVLQLYQIKIDLLVIDVPIDNIDELLKKMDKNSLIMVNKNIDLNIVNEENALCIKKFETENYYFCITSECDKDDSYYNEIKNRLLSVEKKLVEKRHKEIPTVGIGVLTYNHEPYIVDCLSGIYKQHGKFKIKLIIIDDCSNDNTPIYIEEFLKNNTNEQIQVKYIKNTQNSGMINNMKKLMKKFVGTDYFTFCEGDDYWLSPLRIEKFINYMTINQSVSVAFNGMYIYDNNQNMKVNYIHEYESRKFYNTRNLISKCNFIGNFSCCFYDSYYLDKITANLYNHTLYDFLFNTVYSNYGFIGYLHEFLSFYRFHSNSIWSSKSVDQKRLQLMNLINDYNLLTNFVYDENYREFYDLLMSDEVPKNSIDKDIMIIDNSFPCKFNQFTYQEITSYLEYYKNIICISTGNFSHSLKPVIHNEEIRKYKVKNPKMHTKIVKYTDNNVRIYNPKLIYFIFFSSVKLNWEYIVQKKKPFVFELYLEDGFDLNDTQCYTILKEIMSSKYFKKVIVTQTVVQDDLIQKKLCKENKIELILGNSKNIKKTYDYDYQIKRRIEIFNKILGGVEINE